MKIFIISILLLHGCASSKKKSVGFPGWVHAPKESCQDEFICAVGEGRTESGASSSARNEVAKIFKTSISSETTISTSYQSKDPYSGNISENLQEDIYESVDEVLEGVSIERYHKSSDRVYAFARLDRYKTGKILKSKLTEIDDKVSAWFASGRLLHLNKALVAHGIMLDLSRKYQFITRRKFSPKYSYRQISAEKEKKISEMGAIAFVGTKNSDYKDLNNFIKDSLIQNGFKLRDDATDKIEVKIVEKEGHIKVQGFSRQSIQCSLFFKNGKGETVGSTSLEIDQIGRNRRDILKKGIDQLKISILQKIEEINLY